MKLLFEDLNFIVCTYGDLTVEQIRDVFKHTASMYAEEAYCHGCNFTAFAAYIITKEEQNKNAFYGADNNTMKTEEFFKIMKEIPLLQLIPKLVIFQFPQGKEIYNFIDKIAYNFMTTVIVSLIH